MENLKNNGEQRSSMKWERLKNDMELAVEEGFAREFNNAPETADGGKFIAFRYVLDKMNEMDAADGQGVQHG